MDTRNSAKQDLTEGELTGQGNLSENQKIANITTDNFIGQDRTDISQKKKKAKKHHKKIPLRFIIAVLLIILETALVCGGLIYLFIVVPYLFIAEFVFRILCAIQVINSDDNPDYKVPWLFFILLLPVVGFMLYFMFYSRRLSFRQRRRTQKLENVIVRKNDCEERMILNETDPVACSQASIICNLSGSAVYRNTNITYFPSGEEMAVSLLRDLEQAEKFIFLEYFFIEEGELWDSILAVLKKKAAEGVEVRLVYDDIGCMFTISQLYCYKLHKMGIKAVPFGILRGQANNEFNNRDHRKLTVIDGKIGYTGGVNLGDEYVNIRERFGHWKDCAVRMEGEGVNEFTKLILADYESNVPEPHYDFDKYYTDYKVENKGFCVPFGDGPKPVYQRQVSKIAILSLLNNAKKCVYITTPYLIIDNELAQALENAALRGVDVRLITPHIPDKKLVFMMTRSYYPRLLDAGVHIFEYEPGFIHAKIYLADGKYALVGSVNLDYRSLVHHFENGLYIANHEVVANIEEDFLATQEKSIPFEKSMLKNNIFYRALRALVKIFAPLL